MTTSPHNPWKTAAEQTLQHLRVQRAAHQRRLDELRATGQAKSRKAFIHECSVGALDAAIADHEQEMLRAAAVKAVPPAA